jgi:hypothetical protein
MFICELRLKMVCNADIPALHAAVVLRFHRHQGFAALKFTVIAGD